MESEGERSSSFHLSVNIETDSSADMNFMDCEYQLWSPIQNNNSMSWPKWFSLKQREVRKFAKCNRPSCEECNKHYAYYMKHKNTHCCPCKFCRAKRDPCRYQLIGTIFSNNSFNIPVLRELFEKLI